VPQQPEDEVNFYGSITPRLTFSYDPPKVPKARSATWQMKVWSEWSPDHPPGRLLSVETSVPGMQAHIQQEGGATFILVEIAPDCPLPTDKGCHIITLRTDDPSVPETPIPIRFDR
jgi:hypothetical protein